jgi:ribosomal protein L22
MTATENDPDAPKGEDEDEALVVDNGSGMAVAEGAEPEADAPAGDPPAEEAAAKPKRTRAKAKSAAKAATGDADDAAEEKPKRARRKPAAAKAGAAATAEASEEKPKRRTRRKAEPDKPVPAARKKRPAHDWGDNPPMVRAHAKYVRTSARKARLVCDHIRGKDVVEARAILALASRDVARDWAKLLESAVANAEHNHELIGDELRIAAVKADEGPTLKRFRPRAMGRATKIRKRTSHLSITLTPKDGDR